MTDDTIIREIFEQEAAIHENLLTHDEIRALLDRLIEFMDQEVSGSSLPALRYRKMRQKGTVWVRVGSGIFPQSSEWRKFEAYLAILAQFRAARTIKNKLRTENLFFESRSQGEDLHLLVGRRDGSKDKAHLIVDGKTGELRVEDNQLEPCELVSRIEVVLHLSDGRKVLSTREMIGLHED